MADEPEEILDQQQVAGTQQDTTLPEVVDTTQTTESTESVETTDRAPLVLPVKPTRTATDSAWAAMRRADERARRAEVENANLKKQMAAGARPEPPDPSQYTDSMGAIKPQEWRKAQRDHEDRLHVWRQSQAASPVASDSTVDHDAADLAERANIFIERATALKTQHADFDTVVNTPVFTSSLRDAIFDSEQGPEIAYFLGKNPAEATRIGNLPLTNVFREIGRLEARLSANRRTTSNAPEPISPVRANTGSIDKDPEKMSIDEYMAREDARRLERVKQGSPFG